MIQVCWGLNGYDKGVTHHQHDAAHRLVGTTHPDGAQNHYRYTKSDSLR